MQELLGRFSLDVELDKFGLITYAALLFVWVLVLGSTLWSIQQNRFPPRKRMIWMTTVVALPVVGLAIYLPFSRIQSRTDPMSLLDKFPPASGE